MAKDLVTILMIVAVSLRQEMNTVLVKVTNSNGSIIQVPLRKQGIGYMGTAGEYYSTLPNEDQLWPVYGF